MQTPASVRYGSATCRRAYPAWIAEHAVIGQAVPIPVLDVLLGRHPVFQDATQRLLHVYIGVRTSQARRSTRSGSWRLGAPTTPRSRRWRGHRSCAGSAPEAGDGCDPHTASSTHHAAQHIRMRFPRTVQVRRAALRAVSPTTSVVRPSYSADLQQVCFGSVRYVNVARRRRPRGAAGARARVSESRSLPRHARSWHAAGTPTFR